jgi:DNA-binding XRE family transcriptional regulator
MTDPAQNKRMGRPLPADAISQNYTPAAARALREHAGWTQQQAADAVHYADKARWSELERGIREPGAAVWELALIKAGVHPEYRPA